MSNGFFIFVWIMIDLKNDNFYILFENLYFKIAR